MPYGLGNKIVNANNNGVKGTELVIASDARALLTTTRDSGSHRAFRV